jgi:hypothetical protein
MKTFDERHGMAVDVFQYAIGKWQILSLGNRKVRRNWTKWDGSL